MSQTTLKNEHNSLMLAVSQGDKKAFKDLFLYYAPRLKAFLMRDGTSEAIAEEIAQDAFLVVWKRASLFNAKKSSTSTWIFTIARNRKIDMFRKQARQNNKLLQEDMKTITVALPTPEEETATAQIARRLKAMIETLPVKQKSLLELSYFKHMSHTQIAKETKIPLGTIKSRLRLAITKLRMRMGEEL